MIPAIFNDLSSLRVEKWYGSCYNNHEKLHSKSELSISSPYNTRCQYPILPADAQELKIYPSSSSIAEVLKRNHELQLNNNIPLRLISNLEKMNVDM